MLLQDIRYGFRLLRKSPGFTLIAVASLALGIGANATIFGFVNALLLRPLPVNEPEQVLSLYATAPDGSRTSRFSHADFVDLRDRNGVFEGLVAQIAMPLTLGTGEQSEPIFGVAASGNYFQSLGVRAFAGRTLLPDDDAAGADAAVVLSHNFWQRRFGSDARVVGTVIHLNGVPFTVAGVADEKFTGTDLGPFVDVWMPLAQGRRWLGENWEHDRSRATLRVLGRLKEGVSAEQAQAAMQTLAANLAAEYRDREGAKGIELERAALIEGRRREAFSMFFAILLAVVGLVLLIACANVANLLLARAVGRRREIAIRLALGAGRGRVVRQFLTESILVSLMGGACGLLVSVWAGGLVFRLNPLPTFPIQFDLSADWRVIGFALLVSLVTGLVLGVVPALQASRPDLVSTLKDESGSLAGGSQRSRLRGLFVVAQVALSLVLLIGAGLLLRSLRHAQSVDPGFDPENVFAMDFDLDLKGYSEERGRQYYDQMIERVRATAGVRSAALANRAPLDISTPTTGLHIEGFEPPPGKTAIPTSFYRVGPGYFETTAIPLLAGRDFDLRDREGAPRAAVVNETFARKFFGGVDATGRSFRLAAERMQGMQATQGEQVEVVGVARDSKYRTLGEEPTPHVYLPFAQNYEASMTLIVRGEGDPRRMMGAVRGELLRLDGDPQAFFARTMDEHMSVAVAPGRIAAALFTIFGLLALLLAVVGLYGVMAYVVSQRTHEVGIRMALGAQGRDILRLVVGQGMLLVVVGIAVGVGASLLLTRFLSGLLFGVGAADATTFVAVSLLLAAVALLACLIPARRAAKVDPMVALRYE